MKEIADCTVNTNIGEMPLEDYLEIMALQYGFDSYEDLINQGFLIAAD